MEDKVEKTDKDKMKMGFPTAREVTWRIRVRGAGGLTRRWG